jgi:hypothetical protein
MQIIYPKDYLSKDVDEEYREEAKAMRSNGFHIAMLDQELFKLINVEPGPAVFRGWMFSENEYAEFYNQCKDSDVSPITNPTDYLNLHHLPNWYETIRDLTPETVIVKDLDELESVIKKLSWNSYFIKDFVKSLNTDGGPIANTFEQIKPMLEKMEMYRGEIEGGLCIRKVEDFDISTELRFFVLNGKLLNGESTPPVIVEECAKRVAKLSNFFTIDVIKDVNGKDWIVEVGDGQVSGLKEWNIERFVKEFCGRLS